MIPAPYADQLRELRADLVMPEWVARARGIELERHPRRVVELYPTGRSRRRVPVPLVGFSERDLEGVPGSRERRSRWPDREAARRSVLREAAALSVVRYLLEVPADRWEYRGTKRPRRKPWGKPWYKRNRDRYRNAVREVGAAPDAEAWLERFLGVQGSSWDPVGVAVELDAGKTDPELAGERFRAWVQRGPYEGLIWVSLVRGQAERVASVLDRVNRKEFGIYRPVIVLYLSAGWVEGSPEFEEVYRRETRDA